MSRHACVYLVFFVLVLLFPTAAATVQSKEETKPAEGQLSYDELKTMLENLGYDDVKEYKDKDGKLTGYGVKRVAGTWSFVGTFSLSPDKSNIWISISLAKVPDPASVPSKVMLSLLAANNKIWPGYFHYVEASNFICMDSPVANRGVKAKTLRTRFETMCDQVMSYENLWSPQKWPEAKK